MAKSLIVPTHDDVRRLIEVIHYDEHPNRTESAEFIRNKKEFHQLIKAGTIPACLINNGYCEGQTEIHHLLVEYSAGTEIVWEKVNGIFRLANLSSPNMTNPDAKENLTPLCHKHHMGIGTGIHFVTFPAWILQAFLNEKNIALFEAAVKLLKEEDHPNYADKNHLDHHLVNYKAAQLLHQLSA